MFLQMCANLVGHTLVVSATQQVIHVRTGPKLSKPAKLTTPTSSTLRIKRRMSMYSTAWMAPRAGSDWVTETAKERSCGQIISLTTSHTGQRTNPTTSKMRIAFTPWVYDIALCGMMWAATAVITTPVLKVRLRELFPSWSNQLGFFRPKFMAKTSKNPVDQPYDNRSVLNKEALDHDFTATN